MKIFCPSVLLSNKIANHSHCEVKSQCCLFYDLLVRVTRGDDLDRIERCDTSLSFSFFLEGDREVFFAGEV